MTEWGREAARFARVPTPDAPLRVAVLDDNAMFRRTLMRLIARQPGMTVVAEGASGAELDELLGGDAEWLLLDLEVGGESGFDLLGRCRAGAPDLGVILLTGHDPAALQPGARNAGAHACWSKSDLLKLLHELATRGCAPHPPV